MNGVGSYNDLSNYSSPSNLSAFAPPFSVNRSTSNDFSAPFENLADSADAIPSNHFPVCSYGYEIFSNRFRESDSTPSSKPYGYSGLQVIDSASTQLPQFSSLGSASKDALAYDQCCDSIKLSLLEAQPYYPSHISSQTHDGSSSAASNHWSPSSGLSPLDWPSLSHYAKKSSEIGYSGQSPGLWNRFAEFNQNKSKPVEVGSSFCSKQTNVTGPIKENIMNQGCQDFEGLKNGEVLHSTNVLSWKPSVPISADQLDDKSCWWKNIKAVPSNFSSTSVWGSPLMSQETHCEPPLKLVADAGNHHLLFTDSYDKHLGWHDEPPRVDTDSSAPTTVVVKNMNVGNLAADGDLDNNSFSNMKEAYPVPCSGSSICSDLGQLPEHLDYEPTSSNNAMLLDRSVSRDVGDYIFKERCKIQNPHVNLDNLSLRHSANEGVNSVEKFLDSLDWCNPAVDSPCWKGAPAAQYSPFEASENMHPENVKKSYECFGSYLQEPQDFLLDTENNVKVSCEISNNNQIHNEIDYQEKGLTGCPRKFSVTNFASKEYNSDGAVNAGPFQSKLGFYCGLPYLDNISEMRENGVPPSKSIYDCESRLSNGEQIEENKFMPQKHHTSHAAEHGLSSPSSIVDASTKLKTSAGKVSAPKINVQILVKMIHNLSELLLVHCLSDAYELKEQDSNVLEDVIANLHTCALKNAEQMIPAQKCLFPQSYSCKCAKETCELQQNASFERPQLTKVGPEDTKLVLENLPVKDMKNYHFLFGKEHGNLLDSFPIWGDVEMKKEDNMTKAIKRILSENFHDEEGSPESQTLLYKNLWLEAEAALCSVNYRARYDQMMIEMEKYSCKQRDVGEQSKPEVVPKISPTQSSSTKVNNGHSAQDLSVINAAKLKELSCSTFSPDRNKPNTLTNEGKGSQHVDCFFHDSPVSGTNKEAEDYEASVTDRFDILKCLVDSSCINTANLEDLSSSEDSHALDTEEKLASGATDSQMTQNQVSFTEDSPIPGKNQAHDFEASVMARFHILKSRVEDSEGKLLNGVGFAGNGTDCTIIRNASEAESVAVNRNPVMMYLSSYFAADKSTPNEFHPDLEDDQEIQPCGTYRICNQLPTDYSDGFSSDWEHVKKEELAGQTLKP